MHASTHSIRSVRINWELGLCSCRLPTDWLCRHVAKAGGLTDPAVLALPLMLLQIVCPVAKQLSAKQPVLLHFASSTDMYTLMPEGGSRINAPAGLCQGPNITWIARIGSMTYGEPGRALIF